MISLSADAGSNIKCLNRRLKLKTFYPKVLNDTEISLTEHLEIDINSLLKNYAQNCTEYIWELIAYGINDASKEIGTYEIKHLLYVDIPILDNDGNLMFNISKTEFKHCENEYIIVRLECGENIYENQGLKISPENMRNIKESSGCLASAYLNNTVDMKKVEKYFFKREWSPCFDSSGGQGLCSDLKDQADAIAMYAGIPTAALIVLASIIGYFCEQILQLFSSFICSIHHH